MGIRLYFFETLIFLLKMIRFSQHFNIVLAESYGHDFQSFTRIKMLIFLKLLIRLGTLIQHYFTKYFQCLFKINLVSSLIQNLHEF